MNAVALTDALDSAIQKVCSAEVGRLVGQDSLQSSSSEIRNALDSLGGLQGGIQPDYNDPWVALFYLSWYQPRQIFISRFLINQLAKVRNTNTLLPGQFNKLRVIDFGAGALAMQFAVAWAIADDLARGSKIASVTIESYDPNPVMCNLGEKLWEQFKTEANKQTPLEHLRDAFGLVNTSRIAVAGPSSAKNSREERWLSAIHTLYPSNVPDVEAVLGLFAEMVEPHIGLLSGHDHQGMEDLLKKVLPFSDL